MSPDARPFFRLALTSRSGYAQFVFVTAAFAALIAHVAIDALGDILLAHDSYDDIGHGSRTLISCIGLAILVCAGLHRLIALLDETRAGRSLEGRHTALARHAGVAYTALVVGATFILLVGMESVDLALAGQPLGDAGDLLGGSIVLGIVVTLPAALAVAFGAWRVFRWATLAEFMAIRIIKALLVLGPRRHIATGIRSRAPLRHRVNAPALERSTSRRGPPSGR